MSFPAQTGGQAAGSDSSGQQTAGNSPGQTSGSESRLPGDSGDQGTGRDGATGDLSTGQSGNSGSSGGTLGAPSGDYSLETLPSGTLGGGSQQQAGTASGQTGTMTAAERAAVLDERLRRGYEDFDGFILGERERAQRESNEAGSVAILESGGGGGSAGGDNAGQPQTLPANGAQLPSGVVSASQPTQQSSGQAESFPPPEDIPSGRDDDVVARQLREAAMSEPDPELREALWDEYRRYTGIAEGDE